MTVKVDVTEFDIAWGVPRSPCRCPVALALRRVTGQSWDVFGTSATPEEGKTVSLPFTVVAFISVFDSDRRHAQPFTFSFTTL